RKRGWTDALIRDHLGLPDTTCANPHYRSAAPMRLYCRERVLVVEHSETWARLIEKSSRRKDAAGRATNTKRERLLSYVAGLRITIPTMTHESLIERACRNYNEHKEEIAWDRDDWDWEAA